MSETRAKDVDAAVGLIRQAMEKVQTLPETAQERVKADGIAVMLDSVITRIEALGDGESE